MYVANQEVEVELHYLFKGLYSNSVKKVFFLNRFFIHSYT